MIKQILSLSIFVLFITIYSCEETEDGCLDLLGANYDVHAVSACDSCCTYPTLRINYRLMYDTLAISTRDTFYIEEKDTFRLKSLQFPISDIQLHGTLEDYEIRDSLKINNLVDKDDYQLLRTAKTYSIGDIRFEDYLDSISLSIGLDSDLLQMYAPYDEIDQNSTLDEVIDSLYVETIEEFNLLKFQFQLADSIRLIEVCCQRPEILQFPLDTSNVGGSNFLINMEVDIKELIGDTKASYTDEQIANILEQNLYNSISIKK